MFKITLPAKEFYNEDTQQIMERKETTLELEHSLLSISKWESVYEKPFLTKEEKSREEELYYVKCMDLTGKVTDDILKTLSDYELMQIKDYMGRPCTATTINTREKGVSKKNEILTSEVIYYMMIAMEVPIECESWNINRLLMLIRVCAIKNNPKKMGMKDIMRDNAALNKMRRASMGTKG